MKYITISEDEYDKLEKRANLNAKEIKLLSEKEIPKKLLSMIDVVMAEHLAIFNYHEELKSFYSKLSRWDKLLIRNKPSFPRLTLKDNFSITRFKLKIESMVIDYLKEHK